MTGPCYPPLSLAQLLATRRDDIMGTGCNSEREEVCEREVEGRAVPLVPVLRFMLERAY